MFTSIANSVLSHLPGVAYYTAMCMALFLTAPLISMGGPSSIVKACASLSIGILLSTASPFPLNDDFFIITLSGFLIGVYLGFVFTFAFEMVQFAGTLMSYSSQLGFANMVDANTGVQNSVMQRFISHLALLVFIAFGGVEIMVTSMALAPYPGDFSGFNLEHFIKWSGLSLLFGLFMAIPIMVSGFLINIGMGIVTKSAPSMNVFSIGFPVVLLAALLLLFIYIPSLFTSFQYYFTESLSRAL